MASSSSEHKVKVREEFTRQAESYAASSLIKDADRLTALVQAVQPQPGERVLDVATGPGYVAAAFAEAGCEVVGIDLTSAPLQLAEQLRRERGLSNLHFQQGDAEHLPFAAQAFDLVVSRYALHHCEDPRQVLGEMARVSRPQGRIVIQDLIASEFPARAAYHNQFERLRDTSHARALPLSELISLFTALGLEVEQIFTHYLIMNMEAWLKNAHTPEERATQVRELLARDVREDLSGTHPFEKQGIVFFSQRIVTCIGRKVGEPGLSNP